MPAATNGMSSRITPGAWLSAPRTRLRARAAVAVVGAVVFAGAFPLPSVAYPRPGQTERVSVLDDGSESEVAGVPYQLTPDGRYALFKHGFATYEFGGEKLFLPGGLFVRDLVAGRTEQVDLAGDGTPANDGSFNPSISDDGRFVAFVSRATNLGVPDAGGLGIYLRDRATGDTEQVPIPTLPGGEPLGTLGDGWPFISGNGRFVAFQVQPGPTESSILLYDRIAGTTSEILGPPGAPMRPTLSADGRYVAFITRAGLSQSQGAIDNNDSWDAYVLDRLTGKTELASATNKPETNLTTDTSPGHAAGIQEFGQWARLSADGRYVAFVSDSPRLVPEDLNRQRDVFVRDLVNDRTERVSVTSDGAEGYGTLFGSAAPAISADGRYVAFMSTAPLVPEKTFDARADVYVHDRVTGQTERVSVGPGGQAGDKHSYNSVHNYVTADGRRVMFMSAATNLVPGDFNRTLDAFVRDRGPELGVGGMSAHVEGGEMFVSGWSSFSGGAVAGASEEGHDGPENANLTGASVTYRPELGDLLVDLDLLSMRSLESPIHQTTPCQHPSPCSDMTYVLKLVAGGTRYEIRAGWAGYVPFLGRDTWENLFLLFRCDPNCLPVSQLRGGLGTTGPRVRFAVPLSILGVGEGATLTEVQASAGRGHPATGIVLAADTLPLPSGIVPVSTLRLGIAPAGTGEKDVVYGPPVVRVDGSFSETMTVSGKPPGTYEVWARACLGQVCRSASVPVTLS